MSPQARILAEMLLNQLRSAQERGSVSNGEFHIAIKAIISQSIATEDDLAKHLNVPVRTINRWQRISEPQPLKRVPVIATLVEVVQNFLS